MFQSEAMFSLLPILKWFKNRIMSLFIILMACACVDRIHFDIEEDSKYPVPLAVDGFISDQPGPYTIKVSQLYDIYASEWGFGISLKKLTLSDDQGNSEVLTQTIRGTYVTSPYGMRGVVGRAYSIKLEVGDGRIYESIPDTLLPTGTVDSVYFKFRSDPADVYVPGEGSDKYGFDVFFDASASPRSHQFLWKFTGTYKVNVECCECWVPQFNSLPIVSDDKYVVGNHFKQVMADYVHITGYTFYDKVYANVEQRSLSRQAFSFWKAIRSQKLGTNSLFQPVNGKIPTNFIQKAGVEKRINGIFYATSISSKGIFITQQDIPKGITIPKLQLAPVSEDRTCPDNFPNSSPIRPPFWID